MRAQGGLGGDDDLRAVPRWRVSDGAGEDAIRRGEAGRKEEEVVEEEEEGRKEGKEEEGEEGAARRTAMGFDAALVAYTQMLSTSEQLL